MKFDAAQLRTLAAGEVVVGDITDWDQRLCTLVRPAPSYVRPLTLSMWPSNGLHPEPLYVRLRVGSDHVLITLNNAAGLIEELKGVVALGRELEQGTGLDKA